MTLTETVRAQTRQAVAELLAAARMRAGDIFIIGCSSSEVVGQRIGRDSSMEAAQAVWEGAAPLLAESGLYLAAQCCEHLNRAVVLERAAAEKYGYEPVCAVPWLHGGGSFAMAAYYGLEDAVTVEHVQAHAGIDIGDVLIGMQLKAVAVPVRVSQKTIGDAHVVCARTRPKYIGGERAVYQAQKLSRPTPLQGPPLLYSYTATGWSG